MSKFFRLSAALAATTILAGSAYAETIAVSATVQNTCVIDSAGAMGFGNVNFKSGDALDGVVKATSSIQTTCTSGAAYTLTVDNGSNVTTTTRELENGANEIAYVLGTTALGSDVDYEETVGNFFSGTAANGDPVTHTLHGTATVESSDPAGSYTDTLTVTIAF